MKIRKKVLLKNFTWLGVGGPADNFFKANDTQELVQFTKNNQKKITIMGLGSNILVSDSGIRGTVIRLGKGFTNIQCNGETITAGSAMLDINIAKFALANGISGLEFFIGIPGTIGGALAMNAGCYGSDTSSVLQSAKIVNHKGETLNLTKNEIGYVYRGNKLPQEWIFIEGTFVGKKCSKELIKAKMDQITQQRKQIQPIHSKTCGSIFKNPEGYKAWELIEKSGCRGMSLGDAEISQMHCNFVINKGNALAKDVYDLCTKVKNKVKENSGVNLEWEVVQLGN